MVVSDAFKTAVTGSHRSTARVVVYQRGTNTPAFELEVLDGTVEVDASAAVRRRCELTAAGFDLVPEDQELLQNSLERYGADDDQYGLTGAVYGARARTIASGLLAPYGTEFSVYRGVHLPNGVVEEVPLGRFVLTDVDVDDSASGVVVTLTGVDRSQRVADARWTGLYQIPAGTNVATAIQNVISNRVAGFTYTFTSTTRTTRAVVLGEDPSSDPWRDAVSLAASIGCDVFFDGAGVCVLAPIVNTADTEPVWTITAGDGGTLLGLRRRLSRQPTYNGAIVSGEATDGTPPVRAESWDENPASPTYRYGTFGERPLFYVSRMVSTSAQAQDAANALLERVLGLDESLEATIVPMPALDAGDVIQIVRTESRVTGRYIVDRLTVPLRPDQPMTVAVRRSRTPNGEL